MGYMQCGFAACIYPIIPPQILNFRYNTIMQDEQELVARVARGDEQAFLSLYDRHASHIYGLALYIVHDPMLAEEITQDTFLKLWSRARLYLADRGPLIAWLLTIARRQALDRLRFEARRPPLSEAEDPELVWDRLPEPGVDAEEARWRSMHLAVQSLPSDQRQVIELAYYQNLSQSEIAEMLGWPLGTVKTRLRAGMEHLRRVWGAE